MTPGELWQRCRAWLYDAPELGLRLDVSRMDMPADYVQRMEPQLARAFAAMQALEAGAIANPDEGRRVGHYWLRAPELAPTPELAEAIRRMQQRVLAFAGDVHAGRIRPQRADRFEHYLLIGIGGSALGPQFVADALGQGTDPLQPHFIDNTDPDGIDRSSARLGPVLERVLTIVISKSGTTPETRNGMLEMQAAYERQGLTFARHAVVVTGEGSELDALAVERGFLERFPMWDWVGGRTSELSAVGLLPAALQGIDVLALLAGAARMDRATRARSAWQNPAALLALAWFHAGSGHGLKDMVVIPYKDRLVLFSRYLQQLVMESLGKERDLDGNVVHQGLTVYGNKGSTDQHAYVQQLREGPLNFFVTFIQVMRDRDGPSIEVEPQVTSGDYLQGLLLGTRRALYENGRQSLTLTLSHVDPASIGMLIALYERAVGLYASLINVNAYHQPGVEAGKQAAAAVLELQRRLVQALRERGPAGATCTELARAVGAGDETETAFWILERLSANPEQGIVRSTTATAFDAVYRWAPGPTGAPL